MVRLVSFVVLFGVAHGLCAQPAPTQKDVKQIVPIVISGAPAPPLLGKYAITLDYRDLLPGEKVGGLLRSFMDKLEFYSTQQVDERRTWLEKPLNQLPKDLRQTLKIGSGIAYDKHTRTLGMIDQAARYNRTEWNDYFNVRNDGVFYLIPELTAVRELATVIRLRMRCEIQHGEWDRACVSAKTLFGIAHGLEQHPTLIGSLVGHAIVMQALHTLEELVQQPNAPNLYWSLTQLPPTVVSVRNGLSGEKLFLNAQFPMFSQPDRVLSDDEVEVAVKDLAEIVELDAREGRADRVQTTLKRLSGWAADTKRVSAARDRLIRIRGLKPDLVAKITPLQVIVCDDMLEFDRRGDELFKWMSLPFHQARAIEAENQELNTQKEAWLLAPRLLPQVVKVQRAAVRTEQRVAMLRVIEAMRQHVAETGKLPTKLNDCKWPLPNDPISGEAFILELTADGVRLRGKTAIEGEPVMNRQYEIRLR